MLEPDKSLSLKILPNKKRLFKEFQQNNWEKISLKIILRKNGRRFDLIKSRNNVIRFYEYIKFKVTLVVFSLEKQ